MLFVSNSSMGGHFASQPWSTMSGRTTTPRNPTATGGTPIIVYSSDDFYAAGNAPQPAEPYLAEYGNSGPGAHH
jgi:hypothetical protein